MPKLLSLESEGEFESAGFGWRTGHLEYVNNESIEKLGVILINTPQIHDTKANEDIYLEVVKLYGNKELPFRVTGVKLFEDVYDKSETVVLKDFSSLGDAIDLAISGYEAKSVDLLEIEEHLVKNADPLKGTANTKRAKPANNELPIDNEGPC